LAPVLSTRCRPPELGRSPSIIGSQLAGHQSHTQCDWGDQDRTGCAGGPCLKGGKAAALKDGLHHASEELIGEIKVNLGLRWKHTRMGRI